MAMNHRGLGKGIDALFGSPSIPQASQESPLQYVPIDSIVPSPDQPREVFAPEALQELATSIRTYGILEPLLVRPGAGPDNYRLIAGERRLKAARLAGLDEVPVILRQLDDREALIITLLENLQRENLNPIEEAKGIERLRTSLNLTLEVIAETLGKARSTLSHSLRLLKLPEAVQKEVAEGHISQSHAKIIVGLGDDEAILRLARRIIDKGMTARETEDAVAEWNEKHEFSFEAASRETQKNTAQKGGGQQKDQDQQIGKLAKSIGHILNCRANIKGTQDKGKISLAYESNEQLYGLLEKLGLTLDSSPD